MFFIQELMEKMRPTPKIDCIREGEGREKVKGGVKIYI